MKSKKTKKVKTTTIAEDKKTALHYMKTLVDVTREPILILDASLRVISGNPMFYKIFQVSLKETVGELLYHLGNGQWNIPQLKKLLDEILPEKKTVKNYEVQHTFESIGERTILLNARQIDAVQLIILAMEDVTERKQLEKTLATYTEGLEATVAERTTQLAARVKELETLNKSMVGRELKMVELKKEIEDFKKRPKNGNGKNGNGNGSRKNGRQK